MLQNDATVTEGIRIKLKQITMYFSFYASLKIEFNHSNTKIMYHKEMINDDSIITRFRVNTIHAILQVRKLKKNQMHYLGSESPYCARTRLCIKAAGTKTNTDEPLWERFGKNERLCGSSIKTKQKTFALLYQCKNRHIEV